MVDSPHGRLVTSSFREYSQAVAVMDIENSHHTGLLRGDILNTYLVVIATKYGIQRSGDACVFGPSWALTIT